MNVAPPAPAAPPEDAAAALLHGSPFVGYAYGYPHKTAYRALERPIGLDELWRDEDASALFLYVHVPFCTFRCGFCNLFTTVRPGGGDVMARYVDALERQAALVKAALGRGARVVRLAIGGGTPTHLEPRLLARVLDLATSLGFAGGTTPASVEASPDTVDPDKLALLRERGVTRLSLGVQSFVEAEVTAVSRPQKTADVARALDRIRAAGFPVLNVDLIYGLPGQTPASWLSSIEQALAWGPEELFLYPLYVRPLTGLGLSLREWDDQRLALLRIGAARLRAAGYEQVSMRLFRARRAPRAGGPEYCCQRDGMLGLGAGARSYTRARHVSTEWATGLKGTRAILDDWIGRDDVRLGRAEYGVELDPHEQRRRWVIQSVLQQDGLDRDAYRARFGTDARDDLPQLGDLLGLGLLAPDPDLGERRLRPTPLGLERSDAIGPWLYSAAVRERMAGYELR